jgi:cytochrome c553
MKSICAAAVALALVSGAGHYLFPGFTAAMIAQQQSATAAAGDRSWAFPVKNGDLPPEPEGPKQIPGSTKTYTTKEIDDLANAVDWFPNDHPPAPPIVVKGHDDALACGVCHLMNGAGHPESASLAGLNAAYIKRQMADFRSGARNEPNRMNKIAQALTQEEIDQAAEWFSKLPPVDGWTKVTEAATVPKTFVGGGRMRFALPAGGTEPVGARIITLPQDTSRAIKRDIHSGFTAYVPPGSVRRGEALVKTGGSGRTIACTTCHGEQLQGLGSIPRIAGLHPIYIARQLYSFKDGNRHGLEAAVMKKPVEKLTDADIIAISAYVGGVR